MVVDLNSSPSLSRLLSLSHMQIGPRVSQFRSPLPLPMLPSAQLVTANLSYLLSSGTTLSSSLTLSTHGGSVISEEMMNLLNSVLAQIAQQYANGKVNSIKVHYGSNSITPPYIQDAPIRQSFGRGEGGTPRYTISEESWKRHAQAQAILGNLIGPNGEQLASTDLYITTVFVGGLSR